MTWLTRFERWLNRGGFDRVCACVRRQLPGVTLVALIVATALAVTCSGCGRGALAVHARAGIATASVLGVAGEELDAARGRALDRVEEQYPEDPEHDAQLDAEAARWRPAGQALDAAKEALRSWLSAVDLARLADDGEAWLAPTLALVRRVLALYQRVAALSRDLGADVPPLPPFVTGLLGGGL